MSHVEYIEKLLDQMLKDFENEPSDDEQVKAFRQGVKFGMKYILVALKNPIDFD